MQRSLGISVSMVLTLGLFTAGTALAQDVTRPTHIHAGACPAPGDVVTPLTDTAAGTGDAVGSTAAIGVEVGHTTVELALADIVATDHSIVVHLGPDDMGTYLVCGDVGGVPMGIEMGMSDLAVGLAPVGDSTFSGIAWLRDTGDGSTTVNVFIADSASVMVDDA